MLGFTGKPTERKENRNNNGTNFETIMQAWRGKQFERVLGNQWCCLEGLYSLQMITPSIANQ